MKHTIQVISKAVSGERMLQHVRQIACFHRIQASPGFRQAAEYCVQELKREGISAEILSFPAQKEGRFFTADSFQEWSCEEAWCDLVEPESTRLADFAADNISIIQRSFPWQRPAELLDIVLLDKGSDEKNYEGLDLAGKLIFVRDDFTPYLDWAVKKRGAVGILSDYIMEVEGSRERYDLLDIKKYTSFWYRGPEAYETPVFGFVLTPRTGDKLAALCRKLSAEGKYPKARCYVKSSMYDGSLDVVNAFLPGETSEEILITAHLCHPRACANDNASGVSAAMEVLKVLREAIGSGALRHLKRGVRVLLVPEMSGTYAYFDRIGADKRKALAGINLDMVGGRQTAGYGPLTLSGTPGSTPSFVTALGALILDQLGDQAKGLTGGRVAMFHSMIAGFSGGSDHVILSDPTIGIPCPMLGQWPDRYYHTSGDTPEVIDPAILHKSASLAAAYAYVLANLSACDLPPIFAKAQSRLAAEQEELCLQYAYGEIDAQRLCDRTERLGVTYADACLDALRFVTGGEAETMVLAAQTALTETAKCVRDSALAQKGERRPAKARAESPYGYVPKRLFTAPIDHMDSLATTAEKKAALKAWREGPAKALKGGVAELLIAFYMDGRRTAEEIARLVDLEAGPVPAEAVDAYISLLIKLELASK